MTYDILIYEYMTCGFTGFTDPRLATLAGLNWVDMAAGLPLYEESMKLRKFTSDL